MTIKRIALLAAAGALSLSIAACGGGHDEEQPTAETNVTNLEEVPANLTDNVTAEAPAAPRIDNASTEALPEATLTADEQTQADADATGMTSRVSRDEGNGSAGQPAQ